MGWYVERVVVRYIIVYILMGILISTKHNLSILDITTLMSIFYDNSFDKFYMIQQSMSTVCFDVISQ